MTQFIQTNLGQCSTVLADGLKDVATELRTIDLVDIVSYIRFGSFATLEDLVHSSTELFFRPGTLSFAWSAGVDLGWEEPPAVTMGMEFRHTDVSVFFDLSLRASDESVKVSGILFDGPTGGAEETVSRLTQALAEARLPERQSFRPTVSIAAPRQKGP